MLDLFKYAPDGDGGGGGGDSGTATLDQINKAVGVVGENVDANAAKVTEIGNELNAFKGDTEKDVAKLAKQAAEVQLMLAKTLGPSGAEDWLMDMAKFVRGVYRAKAGIANDEILFGNKVEQYVGKAAADFITTTDATAGYLVPDQFMPGIVELNSIYGNMYPLVTKIKSPPGAAVVINRDAARPTAYWRSTQLSAMTEEATPMSFGQESLVSILLGTYIQVANELLNNPSANASAVFVVRMLAAMGEKLEDGFILGTAAGDEPNNGIIAGATDQGTIASMTFALLIGFIQDCIADNDYAYNTSKNKIFMTPADAIALASQAVGASELTGMLVWGDPRKGVPTTVMGYELITHPSFDNSTAKYVCLGDPSQIMLVEDPAFAVDVGVGTTSFVENASLLRVLNHHAWWIGHGAEWHKSIVTA